MTTQNWVSLLKWSILIGLFSLLFTPFIVTESLFFMFITGKGFFFRIIVEIIFALWLILIILEPSYRPQRSPILYSLGVLLVTLFISNWFGVNPLNSFLGNFERMDGYITIAHLAMLVVVFGSVVKEKAQWSFYIHSAVITSLIMVVEAFKQIYKEGFDFRIDTTIGNPIYLAIYMLFNSFFVLWLIAQLKKETFKEYITSIRFWTYVIVWILQVIIIFQTLTRGTAIGLAGGLFVMCLLIAIFGKNEKPVRIVSIGAIALIMVLSSLLYVGRNSEFVQSIPFLQRLTTISITEGTGQSRFLNWGIAWEGVKERPLLGWGQNNYNIVFDKYYDPRMIEQEPWFDRVHNIVFDWLVAGGFVNLLAYLAVILCTMWLIWFRLQATIFEKSIWLGLIVGYFIHNFFVFDQVVSYISFGFVVAYVHSQTPKPCALLSKINFKGRELFFISIIVIVTPIIMWKLHYQPFVAARNIVLAIDTFDRDKEGRLVYVHPNGLDDNLKFLRRSLEKDTFGSTDIRVKLLDIVENIRRVKNVPEKSRADFIAFAEEQLLKEIERNPNDMRFPYLLSGVYIQTQNVDKVIETLRAAVEKSPRKQNLRFLLARFMIVKGQVTEAITLARETYELAPEFDLSWTQYAAILAMADVKQFKEEVEKQISLGNLTRVERVLLENIQRKPEELVNHVSLAAYYYKIGNIPKSLETVDKIITLFPKAQVQLKKLRSQIQNGESILGQTF